LGNPTVSVFDDDVLHKNPLGFELEAVVVDDSVIMELVTSTSKIKFWIV